MSGGGNFDWTIERDGTPFSVNVEYTVAAYDRGNSCGLPEDCDPPSGGEIETLTVELLTGMAFDLTDAERSALEAHIYANHDYSEEPDYDF